MNNPQRHIPFDQIKYVHKLEATGVSRKQAEVQAETLSEFINDQLATKADLLRLESSLNDKIDFKIETLKRDLKIWFGSMLISVVVAMLAITIIIVHVK